MTMTPKTGKHANVLQMLAENNGAILSWQVSNAADFESAHADGAIVASALIRGRFGLAFDGQTQRLIVSRGLAPSFMERMQRVAQDFAQAHLADQKLPEKEREGYTLLLATSSTNAAAPHLVAIVLDQSQYDRGHLGAQIGVAFRLHRAGDGLEQGPDAQGPGRAHLQAMHLRDGLHLAHHLGDHRAHLGAALADADHVQENTPEDLAATASRGD